MAEVIIVSLALASCIWMSWDWWKDNKILRRRIQELDRQIEQGKRSLGESTELADEFWSRQ